jgi:hypothetical protein
MNCTIAVAAMATALSATQVSNEARFNQCARRCKDHGMLGFVFPEFFKAHGFCPFHCHVFSSAFVANRRFATHGTPLTLIWNENLFTGFFKSQQFGDKARC